MTKTPALSDSTGSSTQTAMFLLAAFALGQALNVNNGNLHPLGLMWIGVAMLTLVLALRTPRRCGWIGKIPMSWLAAVCLSIQWAELLVWGIGFRRQPGAPLGLLVTGMTVAAIGVGMILLRENLRVAGLVALIVGHALAGSDVIRHTKEPWIDVWYFQQESTVALLHGQNPYEVRYRNMYGAGTDYYAPEIVAGDYLTVSHPYPPLTLLMAAPARLLGDVRWAHLAALELAALLIALAVPGRSGFIAAAMLLFSPRALMVMYFAWTETMVVLCIAATLFCAFRYPKRLWIALGLLLAVKQYMILVMPLGLLLIPANKRWQTLTKTIALAAGITLPFFLWNPGAFVRSVVLMQMLQPFRTDALSLPAMFAHFTGLHLPAIGAFVGAGAMLVWRLRKGERTASEFAGAVALVLLVFFVLNKQAFCNYYFAVIGACCGAAAVAVSRISTIATEQPSQPLRIAA